MDEMIQRIAVFGSWRAPKDQDRVKLARELDQTWKNRNSRESFEAACKEISCEVARSGNKLLVASDSPSTVDYHIVHGIIEQKEALNLRIAPIHVIRSRALRSSKDGNDCSRIFEASIAEHPALFDEPEYFNGTFEDTDSNMSKWEQVHDHISDKADRVLVIGGGAATHRITNRALGRGKLVVPIGTFGGAGEEILRMLVHVRDTSAVPKYEYRHILADSTWGESQLNASLYALGVRKDPKQRRKVFINYRRVDSNASAYLIRSQLRQELDKDDVFLDHESIEAGSHFERVIHSELNKTKVFLCVIGPSWLKIRDEETGQRRLDMEKDFVRREIEIAIQDGIHIIPVCVEGAKIPKKSSLPHSISELTDRNACFIGQDDIDNGVTKLVRTIRKHLNE
jgi:TIR domain